MICCLGGVYTSVFLDFVSINVCILALYDIPVFPEEPPHELPDLKHLLHHNIPFKASLRSAIRDMLFRNRYNNNCASEPYLYSIH